MNVSPKINSFFSKFKPSNISLIVRIFISFGLIIFIYLLSSSLIGVTQNDIDEAFNRVEKEALPVTNQAYELESGMLIVNQNLLKIISLENEAEIVATKKDFDASIDSLKAKAGSLNAAITSSENLSKTNQYIADMSENLSHNVDKFINIAQSLPSKRLDFVKKQEVLNKVQGEFQSMLNLLTKELQRKSSSTDDTFVINLFNELDKSKFEIERLIYGSFKATEATKINQAMQDLAPVMQSFKDKVEDINFDMPSFKADLNVYLEPIYNSIENKKTGVLGRTYTQALEKEQIDAQANEATQAITKVQAEVKRLQTAASDYLKSSSKKVHHNIEQATFIFICSIVLVLIFVGIVSLSLGHSVRKPISELLKVMDKVGNGDLSSKYVINTNDEFARIGKGLNSLIDSNRTVISNIITNAKKLKNTSSENVQVVDDFYKSLESQRKESFMVASATAELEQTLNQVVESAQKTMDEVTNVAKVSELGREIMSTNITTTHSLDKKLQDTSKAILAANTMGENIGVVVSTIRGIAEQTNLLALNAAIEAARAGDNGRGFAVVADEVRTLANRTSESTKQISSVIEELQKTISGAVKVITTCNEEMNSSLEQSSKANSSLEEIMGFINSIEQMTAQIVESSHEQATATKEINQNITRISDLTEESCRGMEYISSSSDTLNQIADTQSEIVSKFKL